MSQKKELYATFSLSLIMALRMIGLFMVLPLFSFYATQLEGATPTLIGLAIGVYGLSQALLQIPFGWLSDRLGRKPLIFVGLLLFALGSFIAGVSHSITGMIIGRALQGAGAIGSTILAAIADLTSDEKRTKSMAIAGMTIGFSFLLAMCLGPLLSKWLNVGGLFFLATVFSFLAILFLFTLVPNCPAPVWHRDTEPELTAFFKLFLDPKLMRLNVGIFILHAIFTANFIVIPITLNQFSHLPTNLQWHWYLPALLVAAITSLLCIGYAEQKQQVKQYFITSIFLLIVANLALWLNINFLGLCLFFTGFSLLEAFLPSLISRTAPAYRKGSALGVYSSSQFLGIFVGGLVGGWLYGEFSFTGVYFFGILLSFFWLALSIQMNPPRSLITQTFRFQPQQHEEWKIIAAKLHLIPGISEISFIAEENIAYLKMEKNTATHPEFLPLRKQLIALQNHF